MSPKRALIVVIAAVFLTGAASATPAQTWHLQNIFFCTTSGSTTTCGPHLQMTEGGGNGTFLSGFIAVRNGETRTWVVKDAESLGASFGTRAWTLAAGGSSVTAGARWIIGSWDPTNGAFAWAQGSPATLGSSTFTPTASFAVPAGHHLALRVTGTGLVNLIDVYDESGGDSPSTLSVAP